MKYGKTADCARIIKIQTACPILNMTFDSIITNNYLSVMPETSCSNALEGLLHHGC